jgi:hypothetical protein
MREMWVAAWLSMVSPVCIANVLTVFCLGNDCLAVEETKVKGLDVEVYRLDSTVTVPKQWEAQLRALNPKSEKEGEAAMSKILNSPIGRDGLREMQRSAEGIEFVLGNDIEKLPAYMCDEKYVVYGGGLYDAVRECRGVWK